MIKNFEISQNSFEQLLDWLDLDREVAGQKYELIRTRLIKIFYNRGCHLAEDLADETIDRVARKIEDIAKNYKGEPSLYFYGVAKNIFLEYSRIPKSEELPATLVKEKTADEDAEKYHECLDKCLKKISSDQRYLIVTYYRGEKKIKIEQRKKLEKILDISNKTLRVRALRIRLILQKCVLNCVQENFC
jgi:RNA polymerase sigma factor (sigma-70 family)